MTSKRTTWLYYIYNNYEYRWKLRINQTIEVSSLDKELFKYKVVTKYCTNILQAYFQYYF